MSKKILIIDDSATMRHQVSNALSAEDYELLEACDGLEGLSAFRGNRDLALAICDVNMPRMDGIEMLEQMSEEGADFPIVMLTTEGQPAMIQKARKLGARGWIVKPFNPELLVKAVHKLVGRGA